MVAVNCCGLVPTRIMTDCDNNWDGRLLVRVFLHASCRHVLLSRRTYLRTLRKLSPGTVSATVAPKPYSTKDGQMVTTSTSVRKLNM